MTRPLRVARGIALAAGCLLELAASWLWVIGLGGLVLWVDRVRRRKVRGWHGTVGIAILVGVLGLSATGLTWSYYAGGNVSAVRSAAGWLAPSTTRPSVMRRRRRSRSTSKAAASATGWRSPTSRSWPSCPSGASRRTWATLFGWVNRVALLLLACAIVAMIGWGYLMWWHRRPTRGGSSFGVGLFLPLLGVSLLAFLAVDVVLSRRPSRRSPAAR